MRFVLVLSLLSQISFGGEKPILLGGDQSRPAVVVLNFGWGSCKGRPSDVFETATQKKLLESLRLSNRKIQTFISCFTTTFKTYNVKHSYIQFETPDGRHLAGTFAEYRQRIIETVRRDPRTQLYIFGHSYGGWMSMKLARSLPTDVWIPFLMTSDAISPLNCNPGHSLEGFYGWGMGSTSSIWPGCLEFPQDMLAEADVIRDKVGVWYNNYQTYDTLLQSGPLAAAHFNTKLTRFEVGQHKPKIGRDRSHKTMMYSPVLLERLIYYMVWFLNGSSELLDKYLPRHGQVVLRLLDQKLEDRDWDEINSLLKVLQKEIPFDYRYQLMMARFQAKKGDWQAAKDHCSLAGERRFGRHEQIMAVCRPIYSRYYEIYGPPF